jgi:hypothetical protein
MKTSKLIPQDFTAGSNNTKIHWELRFILFYVDVLAVFKIELTDVKFM